MFKGSKEKKIIKNGKIIVGKDLEIINADILIDGTNIVEIRPEISDPSAEIIDATDKLVMPGLVNAHLHSDENLFKGLFDNLPLEVWINYTAPTLNYGPFCDRLIYLRTMLGAIEMIKGGVTLIQDDVSHYPVCMNGIDAVMYAYRDIGMRANVTANLGDKEWKYKIPYVADMISEEIKQKLQSGADKQELLTILEKMIIKWHEPKGMINVSLSPVAPQRCSDEYYVAVNELSQKYDLPVNTHILETKMQSVTGPEFYGKSIIEHINDLGVMSDKMSIIHAVWMSDSDIELMGRGNVSVIHNPVSNLKLGSGIMPFRKLKDAGINIALGTDGMSSNDNQSMFEVMKMAALLHKVTNPDYATWHSSKEIFKCATQNGAKSTMRDDHTGIIAEGMRADLVILNLNTTAFTPLNDPINHLVYCENGSSIEKVMINGQIVVENGKILTINEAELLDELRMHMVEFNKKYKSAREWADKLTPYVDEVYKRCVQKDIGVNRWSDDQNL